MEKVLRNYYKTNSTIHTTGNNWNNKNNRKLQQSYK